VQHTYIYSEKHEITSFRIKDARQVSEMNFEFYDEEFRPLNRGDMYFTPDGTAFIEADYELPPCLEGKKYCFALKTAAEMIVRVNGVYVGGIDPNRERINLSEYVDGTKLHFDIVGYNRSKPDDERNPESLSVRGCRQIFEGGYISVVNEAVQSLVYDLEMLLDAALSEVFNEDFSALVIREIDAALNLIDFDDVCDDDVRAASEYIDKNIFSLSGNKFSKGIGAHAESDIIMDIPAGAKKFVAVVGMDDEVIAQMTQNKVKEPNFYGMIFHVYIDGKHVDQSSLLGITKHYVFDIDIPEGAKQIRLYADHVAYTGKDYDHADWAVAGFINNPIKN
jgi:hypothetical protein